MPPNGEAKQDKKQVYEAGPIAATEAVVLKIRATVQSVTILCAVLGSGKGLAAPAAYVVTSIEHPQQLSSHFILATQDFVLSNCSMGRVISLVVFTADRTIVTAQVVGVDQVQSSPFLR